MSFEERFPATGDASAASAALVPHPSPQSPEEELAPSDLGTPEAVIRALLDGSVVTVSSSGLITEWNERARRAFGFDEESAVGRSLLEVVVPAETRGPAEHRLAELLGGHYGALRSHRLDVHARHESGRDLRATLVLLPIPLNESSELSALLGDIAAVGDEDRRERIRERHADTLKRLSRALALEAEAPEQRHDNRVAGVVIVFEAEAEAEAQAEAEPEAEPEAEIVVRAPEFAPVAPAAPRGPALEEDRFALCAQPVLQLASNAVVQHELLLRMTGADGALQLPRAFLPAMADAGLMAEVDTWVMRRAIELIADQEHAGRKLRLEVNLSADAVTSASFALTLEAELAAQAIDPSRLVLEVSEDLAAEHSEATSALARRARGLGCRFAIDNVGSSFASLRHLKHIPIDYLKIDGSLTASLTESRADRLVLEALVGIAHGLGAAAVAEWVSDVETVALLREAAVDMAQGHRIGRPLPIGETPHHTVEHGDGY